MGGGRSVDSSEITATGVTNSSGSVVCHVCEGRGRIHRSLGGRGCGGGRGNGGNHVHGGCHQTITLK